MRSSITCLLVGWIALLLIACGASTPPAETPTAQSAETNQLAPTATNTLPPPMINVSTPFAIAATPEPAALADSAADAAETNSAASQPLPTSTPQALSETMTYATSEGNQPITATRFGTGPFKVVLAADNHSVGPALLDHFANRLGQIPADLSVWVIPNVNPDGWSDVVRAADASFDGCRRNDGLGRPWEPAAALGLRDFLQDAAFVVIYENAPINVVHNDSCAQNRLAAQMLGRMAELENAQLAPDETAYGYSPLAGPAGHFIDYLAGEGIAALTVGLRSAQLEANVAVADQLLAELGPRLAGDNTVWINDNNINKWVFSPGSLIHPLAITQRFGIYYILDSGRLLAIDPNVADGTLVEVLAGGADVEETRVLEMLDLAVTDDALYALDRAGDVYRLADGWVLDRYDRPVRDRSAHYYVALSASAERMTLLEASAPLLLRYANDEKRTRLPDQFYPIDVDMLGETAFVLMHEKNAPFGEVRRYVMGEEMGAVPTEQRIVQPRQVLAIEGSVFVLDLAGRRLRQFAPDSGQLIADYRFHDNRPISSMYSDGESLVLAGRDALYFLGHSETSRAIDTDHLVVNNPPHDIARLSKLSNMAVPIGIPQFIQRDYQMSGAPRHYRLGVHEGYDFYWSTGSQVLAAADGVVVRADWEYQEPWQELFDLWRNEAYRLGFTSADGSDFFRGRQVWIDHGDGIVSRYVHLSGIDPAVQVGATVARGQLLAYVGNSGSPASLEGPDSDAHLHFELRIDDGYMGQYLRPIEAREWLRRVLRQQD